MIKFTNMEVVGFIPQFLSEWDPRPAKEQIDEHYSHGGGWRNIEGFKLVAYPVPEEEIHYGIKYPGDPMMREMSRARLRNELLVFFQGEWLAIIQPDGSYEVCRLN